MTADMTTDMIADPSGTRSPGEVLSWSRATLEPALRGAVDTLPGSLRHLVGYHFGWWDERGGPTGSAAGSGKAIRPALVFLASRAVGGDPLAAMPAAVAVELVHNFSLVHDDVMDGDHTRRHRRTVWSVFGVGPAILAGDALVTLAMDVLDGHPATSVLAAAVQDLLSGQSADLEFEDRNDVVLPECVRMAQQKTGALLGCSCAIGASFAGAEPVRVEHLRGFGEQLGLAFQVVDDLLGIWGDPAVTGKPVFSDLENRKKSLPVVAALTSGTPAGELLAERYATADEDLPGLAALIDEAGGRAWAHQQADALVEAALCDLRLADPAPGPAAELTGIADLVTHRDS
ncbi:geranylgeranyl diphosphate synthase type I [Labedaea rhizosphaerae]|uniref:Geranylgeranyl diphosphate synthase type I n=2 Tax=Labedaea rhizosphaerae TaxID=598644 RepID=A0A4R6S9M1_LABRH|nr:geranylgeranyl diphosphate synthase type I [Labedaea rhizosphaerae]